jgi:hypothetical protein
MAANETAILGQMVVDHFTRQSHDPWEQAQTLEDVAPGLHVVRVLIRMGRYKEAFDAYSGDLATALFFNLGARAETQALLKPFFPNGWNYEPVPLGEFRLSYLLAGAAASLSDNYAQQATKLFERLIVVAIARSAGSDLAIALLNLQEMAWNANRLAETARLLSLALEIAKRWRVAT